MKKTASGFTLVELLIVVAIIGVLSIIGITSYSSVQSKARDTKRKADIEAIAKVMESKYSVRTATYDIDANFTNLASGFADNKLPSPPRDKDYAISTDSKSFVSCAKLDAAPAELTLLHCIATVDSTVNRQNCYCRTASSGSYQNIITAIKISAYPGLAPGQTSPLQTVEITSEGTVSDLRLPVATACNADVNRDGIVNCKDLAIVVKIATESCPSLPVIIIGGTTGGTCMFKPLSTLVRYDDQEFTCANADARKDVNNVIDLNDFGVIKKYQNATCD